MGDTKPIPVNSQSAVPTDEEKAKSNDRTTAFRVSILISIGAVMIAAVHAGLPDLKIDTVTLGLIGIAIIPWLGQVLESLELPFGFKAKYRKLEKKVAQVSAKADEAVARVDSATQQAETLHETATFSAAGVPTGAKAKETLDELIKEYDDIRAPQKRDALRTSKMTNVVGKMIALMPQMENTFDVRQRLHLTLGERLAAYAYLYTMPNHPELLEDLIRSVAERDPTRDGYFMSKPFEQYWGILAIGKVLGYLGVDHDTKGMHDQLNALLGRLTPGTDRHAELSRIIRSL